MIGYRKNDKQQPHGFGFDIRAQPKEVMIIAPLKYEDDDFVKQRKKDYKEAKEKRDKEKGLIDMNSLLDKDRK